MRLVGPEFISTDDRGQTRNGRTTILFIAGAGRSCTTFLGHVLGQIKGFAFVGEAVHAWRAADDRFCGCGARLPRCDFWSTVRRGAGDGGATDLSEFFALGRLARWRHLPWTYLPAGDRPLAARYGKHWTHGERLYRMTAAVSGADVIVDSSKSVPYARMLGLLPGLDVRVVHLVRDARAVAHSWTRRKPAPDRAWAFMGQRHPAKSALYWNVSNVATELLLRPQGPYLRLRYEDLAARPVEAVERIVRLATAPSSPGAPVKEPVELPFVDERTVTLAPTHSIKGNPDRMQTGRVEVRLDDRWRREMRPGHRRLVTALTWPLLARYGYVGG